MSEFVLSTNERLFVNFVQAAFNDFAAYIIHEMIVNGRGTKSNIPYITLDMASTYHLSKNTLNKTLHFLKLYGLVNCSDNSVIHYKDGQVKNVKAKWWFHADRNVDMCKKIMEGVVSECDSEWHKLCLEQLYTITQN